MPQQLQMRAGNSLVLRKMSRSLRSRHRRRAHLYLGLNNFHEYWGNRQKMWMEKQQPFRLN